MEIFCYKTRFYTMTQRFGAILLFYRSYFIWSFIINIVFTFVNHHIVPAILTKLFLTIILWHFVKDSNAKHKLTFYNKLGISSFRLFSSIFIMDILIMIVFLSFVKVFI